VSFTSAIIVVWSARWRLQREQCELKTPQEHASRDEEAEAVPAESVHLERKKWDTWRTFMKRNILRNLLF
jgi:hypothetical protein